MNLETFFPFIHWTGYTSLIGIFLTKPIKLPHCFIVSGMQLQKLSVLPSSWPSCPYLMSQYSGPFYSFTGLFCFSSPWRGKLLIWSNIDTYRLTLGRRWHLRAFFFLSILLLKSVHNDSVAFVYIKQRYSGKSPAESTSGSHKDWFQMWMKCRMWILSYWQEKNFKNMCFIFVAKPLLEWFLS